ncbi:MAG: hypothetical protein M9938_07330 [Solirubrobacterales bacterium]|nr:hypothetical protein [Solirubrobacterales bacterium]
MSLGRASWLAVVAVCAIAAVGTFIAGYAGYGATVCAVGLAAAVNLLPGGSGADPGRH